MMGKTWQGASDEICVTMMDILESLRRSTLGQKSGCSKRSNVWMEKMAGACFPERIIRNGPATIVFWPDGTKTIVKRSEDDPDDLYSAVTAAICINIFGSNSKLKRIIKKAMS